MYIFMLLYKCATFSNVSIELYYMFWSFVELVMNSWTWNGIVLYLYVLVILPIFFFLLHTCYALAWIVEVEMVFWLHSPFFCLHTCYVLVCFGYAPHFFSFTHDFGELWSHSSKTHGNSLNFTNAFFALFFLIL